VVEEQVVIQGHCSIYNVSPSESVREDSNSGNDSVDEENSRYEVEDVDWVRRQNIQTSNSKGNSCIDDSMVENSVESLAVVGNA